MKKTFYISIALLFTLLITNISVAQNRTIVQMEVTDAENAPEPSVGSTDITIKINPSLLVRGDMPLYVEFPIKDALRIEAGVGITLRDYWGEIVDDNYAFLVEQGSTVSYSTGTSARLGLKYYISDYGYSPEGYFFGAEYRYQNYNTTLLSYQDIDGEDIDLLRRYNDFRFLGGYSQLLDENIFVEFYAGFGLRSREVDIPDEINVNSGFTSYSIERQRRTVLLISGGIKLGITL